MDETPIRTALQRIINRNPAITPTLEALAARVGVKSYNLNRIAGGKRPSVRAVQKALIWPAKLAETGIAPQDTARLQKAIEGALKLAHKRAGPKRQTREELEQMVEVLKARLAATKAWGPQRKETGNCLSSLAAPDAAGSDGANGCHPSFKRSSLRAEFDVDHVKVIAAVVEAISGPTEIILQAPGHDGWVITVGAMVRHDRKGYANTFDPPSKYEDTWFRNPETAAKIFVDAVGGAVAQRAIRRSR